ncbi:HVA22-like protein h isoform X2 [Mangifera indica]|uniref:HVA22-like protein h isoform X2 n=1 Tax=Mangifera indica TaxID=29780 RepID=UPI001CF9B325|nr:HVA22-like protein h isoform X2 [Mangifera indica]
MGFIIILQFVIKCFYVVPWTISALVYPLYASIRAIETDSASDFRKLVAYWILFSLTFLFEGAFVRLLEWLPFLWPYIKLVIFCWLVLSNFDGAYYVYKHVLHPCISLDVEDLINQFKERMEYFSTRIKVVAEEKRQEKENVGETLHELLKLLHETAANKSKGNEPINILQKNVKAFEATEKKEVAKAKQSKCEESINVVQKDMKSQSKCEDAINVVQKDMKAQLKCEEPINVVHKDMKAVEVAEKTEMAKQDGLKEHCVFLSENKKSEPEEIKRVSATTATRSEVSEIPVSNEVQQEWTCSLCQVTTPCEAILKLHLQGRQHKLCEEQLKAKNQPSKSKVSPVPEDKKSEDCEVPKQKPVQVQPDDQKYKCVELKGTLWCCTICNVSCASMDIMFSHLNGKKHLAKIRQSKVAVDGHSGWDI